MKKLLSILLFCSLIVPVLGTYGWLKYERYKVKKSVKQQLKHTVSKDELVKLSFTDYDADRKLDWEHSKEFEYDGLMYDVVYSSKENGVQTYWCWLDSKESKLNQQLTQLVTDLLDNNPDHKKQIENLIDFMKTIYFTQECLDSYVYILAETKVNSLYSLLYHFVFSSSADRPPQIS